MVYDQLYMEYKLPEGTNSTRVAHDLEEIRNYLQSRPEIRNVTASVGGTCTLQPGPQHRASLSLLRRVIIDFESPKHWKKNLEEIQSELLARYPDAYVKLKRPTTSCTRSIRSEVLFTAPIPAVLHALADSTAAIMASHPEVRLITTDWEPAMPLLEIISTNRRHVGQIKPARYFNIGIGCGRRNSCRNFL